MCGSSETCRIVGGRQELWLDIWKHESKASIRRVNESQNIPSVSNTTVICGNDEKVIQKSLCLESNVPVEVSWN